MGGYAAPPLEEWRPATAAEADYNNRIGRENRARVGLGSSYGRSSEYEVQVQQQQPVQTQRQVDANRNQQAVRDAQARGDAYRMAMEAERTGRVLDPYVEKRAREQGFGGNVLVGDTAASRSTVPTREYEALPSTMPRSDVKGFGETITGYTPYGRGQTELERVKVKYTPYGEVGFYQKDPTRDTWRLVSSGSVAALQSGQFTRDAPQTPLVFTQASGGRVLSPRADVGEARKVQANPRAYSRLGAEAYGGFVMPLDNRTVESTGAKLSTYQNQNNLANLVDPQAVNVPKSQREPVTVPWGNQISASTPAVSPVTPEPQRVVARPAVTPAPAAVPIKPPFRAQVTHTIIPPSGETTIGIPFTGITLFKGFIPGFTEVEKGILQKPTIRTTGRSGPDVEAKTMIGTFPNAKTVRFATTSKGLDTAPAVPVIGETYSGGSPEVDALETSLATRRGDIESRQSRLDTIMADPTRVQDGVWVGPEDEYYTVKAESEVLDKDISAHNADVERFNKMAKENPTYVTTYDMTKGIVTPTATYEREGMSGYDRAVAPVAVPFTKFDTKIKSMLPAPEVGERAVRMASLTNPFMVAPVVTSVLTERFNPSAAGNAQTVESLVGMRGQYTQFKEAPLMTVGSYGAGLVFGGVVRGATGAAGYLSTKLPVAKTGLTLTGKGIGVVLAGVYTVDVGSRATQGFTNFEPQSVVGKTKSIVMQETVPLGIGFGHGYRIPETLSYVKQNIPKPGLSRYERGVSVVDNEAAVLMPNARKPVSAEPVATKKPVGYSTAQMMEAWKLKGVPQDYGVPRAYKVPEPSGFLYAKSTVPVAGGVGPVGSPRVKGFEPSSSVNKMVTSKRPSYQIFDVEPTYGVAGTENIGMYGRGVTRPGHIEVIPGTRISRLKSEPLLPTQKVGKKGRYFMDEKSVGGGSGGGSSGGVIGSVGSRGGVSVNVATGKLVRSPASKLESSSVSSGIFRSGAEYELSAEGMTLSHLNPNRRVRILEDMQPEVIYTGKIPGVNRPKVPVDSIGLKPGSRVYISTRTGYVNANRQKILTKPDLGIGERLSERSLQRPVPEKSDIQKRIREKGIFVSLSSRQAVTPVQDVTNIQRIVPASKTTTSSLQKQIQIPGLTTIPAPKLVTRQSYEPKRPPTPPPEKPPGIPLPLGSGGGFGSGFALPRYYVGYKERSPTWTVDEMATSLFTGHLGPVKHKPKPPEVDKKKGRKKKVRNIRR